MTHRGSGRGPHTVEQASHLDAADAARAVALRRDRLVGRQRHNFDSKRQAEIDMLGEVWRLYRGFDEARNEDIMTTDDRLIIWDWNWPRPTHALRMHFASFEAAETRFMDALRQGVGQADLRVTVDGYVYLVKIAKWSPTERPSGCIHGGWSPPCEVPADVLRLPLLAL